MTAPLSPAEIEWDAAEAKAVAEGKLPARYGEDWVKPFDDLVAAALKPGIRVLDVGSGAHPSIPIDKRPEGCHYIGLDISQEAIDRAPAGSYDEILIADISNEVPALEEKVDLIISWQVLEHVSSMEQALANQLRVLRPGGQLVAQLSGKNAFFSIASRMIPFKVGLVAQERLLGVEAADHFPTVYDGCTDRELNELLAAGGWSSWQVTPRYKAGGYLRFAPVLQRTFLVYENWAERKQKVNLASHYLVHAVASS